MEPSKYQTAVYEEVQNHKPIDVLVKATAGSGKTTTIVNASKLLPKSLDVVFLAFNKSIVVELQQKLPENVKCSTLHSFGMSALYKFYTTKKLEVKNYKTNIFFDQVIKDYKIKSDDLERCRWVVNDIIDKARINHTPNKSEDLMSVADYYGILFENSDIDIAKDVYKEIIKYNEVKVSDEKIIDFTDMIYIPSFYEVKLPKFDVVFVDEAQDLNKSQQIMVNKIKNKEGRAIYVGDENQAIYMFAGADANSFNNLGKGGSVSLPLSVCYRCAKDIVSEAQRVVGVQSIESFPGQEKGLVTHGSWEDIKEGDFVVCRNNAPLFSLYFDLLVKGIKAKIKGREIETQLLNLVKKVKFSTTNDGINKLELMQEKIEDELRKKGKENPEKSKRWQNFNEMKNIIKFLAEEKQMMLEVADTLNEIFREDKPGATLMTIHKSKGLEAENVHFLLPSLLPSKFAETEEELKQEDNLKFVAITRAKKHLNYIDNYETRIEV